MMRYCDQTDKVLKWASEEIAIKYWNPVKKRPANYYPDFYVEYINKFWEKKKMLVEVKPSKETKPPVYKKRTKNALIAESLYTHTRTKQSGRACKEEFCLDNGLEFKIFTEHELGINGRQKKGFGKDISPASNKIARIRKNLIGTEDANDIMDKIMEAIPERTTMVPTPGKTFYSVMLLSTQLTHRQVSFGYCEVCV